MDVIYIERHLSIKYKFIEMMNPESLTEELYDIIDSISANECYFLVYYKENGKSMKDVKNAQPHLLVFENDDEITVEQLMTYFSQELHKPEIQKTLMWQLALGFSLERQMKIKEIKKELRIDNINGLSIFTRIKDLQWTDECAIKNLVEGEIAFNEGEVQLPFHLTDIKFIIYLPVHPKSQLNGIKNKLCVEIKRIFGLNMDSQNIQILINVNNTSREAKIYQIRKGQPNSTQEFFSIKFLNQVILKTPPRQNNTFIIIKGKDFKSEMLHYDDIRSKKVVDVLTNIKPLPNWHQFGLLISENVLRSHDTFQKLNSICKNSGKHTKHLHAHIIEEAHIFQLQKQNIQSKGLVDFEKIIVPNQGNLKLREQCQIVIKNRAEKANHEWFKGKLHNVKPILLYTSEICVKGTKGTSCSLYRTMNTFLRDQQFGKIKQEDYQKWQYRFACELWNQLKMIPLTPVGVLWRGVSYVPKNKVDEIVMFKQFNSSSKRREKAEEFANKAIYKISKAKSCRSIKEYSYYQSQDQFLFEPYVAMKINKVSTDLNKLKNKQIVFIEAEQVEKAALPDNKSLFILWVDDKTIEGKTMWENLIQIQKTTVMIQLLSTEQLQKWLQENKSILNDSSVEIVMITNMTRYEKEVKVQKAGVYAIDAFRKYKPNNNIFVYIGWVEGTLAKLKQHKYIPNDKLRVSDSISQIRNFLKEIGVK